MEKRETLIDIALDIYVEEVKAEYERIRNYEYDEYDNEFEAMDKKSSIEKFFYLMKIDFNKFDR